VRFSINDILIKGISAFEAVHLHNFSNRVLPSLVECFGTGRLRGSIFSMAFGVVATWLSVP
jgi:hypothetical protein